jgi:ADP-ribose pyrophosphatase
MAGKTDIIYSAGRTKFASTGYRGSRFYFVDSPDVVVLVPLIGKDRVVLERQYRPIIGKYVYELPAGKLNAGESHRRAALRELREETGYTASRIAFLARAYTSPGIQKNLTYFYAAGGLKKGRVQLDKDENISLKVVTLKDAIRMTRTNEIEDVKSIAALLYYSAFVR